MYSILSKDMLDIPNFMINQLSNFTKNDDFIGVYQNQGYNIEYDLYKFNLIITYKEKQYDVNIFEKNNNIYWHINFENSFFDILLKNKENDIARLLYKIKEHYNLLSY